MSGKMLDPILLAGGTPQEMLAALIKISGYTPTKEQEYTCLKILYCLSKYATVMDFTSACVPGGVSAGVTGKQLDAIRPFIRALETLAK